MLSRAGLFAQFANEIEFVHARLAIETLRYRERDKTNHEETQVANPVITTDLAFRCLRAPVPLWQPQRLRRIDSRPASIVSIEVEKEKRTWPSPWGPKTTPGTVDTRARLRSNSDASRLSLLMVFKSGNA